MKYCTKLRIVTQKLHGNTKSKKALLRANSEAFDGIPPFRAGTQILQRLLDEASEELLLEKFFFSHLFMVNHKKCEQVLFLRSFATRKSFTDRFLCLIWGQIKNCTNAYFTPPFIYLVEQNNPPNSSLLEMSYDFFWMNDIKSLSLSK